MSDEPRAPHQDRSPDSRGQLDVGPPPSSRVVPARYPPQTVSDVMTRQVIAMGPEKKIAPIEAAMKRFRFRHLPVIDGDNKVVGLLTYTDLMRASASVLSSEHDRRDELIRQHTTVAMIMTREVVTVRPEMDIIEAGELMWEKRLGCLVVTADDGYLLGILTEGDFIKLALMMVKAGRP